MPFARDTQVHRKPFHSSTSPKTPLAVTAVRKSSNLKRRLCPACLTLTGFPRPMVEKQNHTLRMHCRRLTRLMNAFSEKFKNFQAAVSPDFAYYNFVKMHGAIRMDSCQTGGALR
jgi:hypothetical protein